MDIYKSVAVIILAAGKGTRMNVKGANKVTLMVGNEPIIHKSLKIINALNFGQVVVVVGHEAESVKKSLKQFKLEYVNQEEQLGTGHAVKCGLSKVGNKMKQVLVVNGDDSWKYDQEVYKNIVTQAMKNDLVLLTTKVENPTGLGRVIRDKDGKFVGVVEEKEANKKQKLITETSTGAYCFSYDFLKKYIDMIPPHTVEKLGVLKTEYYLPDLVKIAIDNKLNTSAVLVSQDKWLGINTPDDLKTAANKAK